MADFDGAQDRTAPAMDALADIMDGRSGKNPGIAELDEGDRRIWLRAEVALMRISERQALSRWKTLGLFGELLRPELWRILGMASDLNRIRGRLDAAADARERPDAETFLLALSADDHEPIEIRGAVGDVYELLYMVGSAAHAVRRRNIVEVSGIRFFDG